jgi:hypothetical protein
VPEASAGDVIDRARSWYPRVVTRPLALLASLLSTALACANPNTDNSEDDPLDFPPVECGDVTCGEGLICVKPNDYCDYDLDPPDWVQPPLECAAPPANCVGLSEPDLSGCLLQALCESLGEYEPGFTVFVEGLLDCPTVDLDCFE